MEKQTKYYYYANELYNNKIINETTYNKIIKNLKERAKYLLAHFIRFSNTEYEKINKIKLIFIKGAFNKIKEMKEKEEKINNIYNTNLTKINFIMNYKKNNNFNELLNNFKKINNLKNLINKNELKNAILKIKQNNINKEAEIIKNKLNIINEKIINITNIKTTLKNVINNNKKYKINNLCEILNKKNKDLLYDGYEELFINVINKKDNEKLNNGLNKLNNIFKNVNKQSLMMIKNYNNDIKQEEEKKENESKNIFLFPIIYKQEEMTEIIINNKEEIKEEMKENIINEKIKNKPELYNNIKLYYSEDDIIKTTVNSSELIESSKKPESIFSKIAITNSQNDTAKINYYEGYEIIKDKKILYLSDMFCDNILLYIISERDKDDKNKSKHDEYGKKEIANFLKNNGLKPYEDYKMKSIRIESEDKDLKTQNKKYENQNKKYNVTNEQKKLYCKINNINDDFLIKYVKQIYKISLSEIPLKRIYEIFNKENLNHLSSVHNIHFYDIDITRDIAGAFKKEGIIKYMTENLNCYIKNTEKTNKKYDDDQLLKGPLNSGEIVILDNNKTVGRHCLSFLKKRGEYVDRSKFYNKFICNLESSSLDKKIGSKLYEFIYNTKDKRLFNTIKNGRNYGILRMETTYTGKIPTLEQAEKTISDMEDILLNNINDENYMYCPIYKQWQNYINNTINENLIINNAETNEILFIRSINSETGRINGVFIDKGKNKTYEKYIHNFIFWLSYYTFKNKPIRILNLKYDYEEEKIKKINLSLNTYKILFNSNINNDKIYICNDDLKYFKPEDEKFNYTLSDVGINDINDINFCIPEKKHGFKLKDINFNQVISDRIINNFSFKKMKKITEDIEYENNKKLLIEEESKKNLELEKKQLNKYEELNKLILLYEENKGNLTDLKCIMDDTYLNLVLFKEFKNDYYLCLLYIAKDKKYIVCAANTIMKMKINEIKNKCEKYEYKKNCIINYLCENYKIINIMNIKKNENRTGPSGNLYAHLNIYVNKINDNEDKKDIILLKENLPKIKDCMKMEELTENNKYKILKIGVTEYGKKMKYIMDLKNNDDEIKNVISNYYLEDILKNFIINRDIINHENIFLETLIKKSDDKKGIKVKIMDCILNIKKTEEMEQKKNEILNIQNKIIEKETQNKQDFLNKIDDEFNNVNINYLNIEKEELKKFYDKYYKNIKYYKYSDNNKVIILKKIYNYLNSNKNIYDDEE